MNSCTLCDHELPDIQCPDGADAVGMICGSCGLLYLRKQDTRVATIEECLELSQNPVTAPVLRLQRMVRLSFCQSPIPNIDISKFQLPEIEFCDDKNSQ